MAEQSDNDAKEGQRLDGAAADNFDDLQGENNDSAGDEGEAEDASESVDFDKGSYTPEGEQTRAREVGRGRRCACISTTPFDLRSEAITHLHVKGKRNGI